MPGAVDAEFEMAGAAHELGGDVQHAVSERGDFVAGERGLIGEGG